jgi:hypothetical protein
VVNILFCWFSLGARGASGTRIGSTVDKIYHESSRKRRIVDLSHPSPEHLCIPRQHHRRDHQFPFWQSSFASHSHHFFFFFPLARAIASQPVTEGPDFQGANNKRFPSFFLFQTMSYAQTSGGGNPGTQKWGRGTWIPCIAFWNRHSGSLNQF